MLEINYLYKIICIKNKTIELYSLSGGLYL